MKNFIISLIIAGNSIIGTISDNNEKLTGVKISSPTQITYSDFDGNFKINLSDTLLVEFISYKDTIIVLDNAAISKK